MSVAIIVIIKSKDTYGTFIYIYIYPGSREHSYSPYLFRVTAKTFYTHILFGNSTNDKKNRWVLNKKPN